MTVPPPVSILMTVYNREDYLAQALESVLASSYASFEVVVVDDCSSDASVEIAKRFAASDDRVRVFENDANLGDYGNRMKAASLARGELLKYVDSDDLIYPHSLRVMVEVMEANPDVGLAFSYPIPELDEPYPVVLSSQQAYLRHFLGRGCFGCGPTAAIIRRSAFQQVGGFRPEWKVLSDIDLWLRLGARHSVALLPPGLVWWRRHEGQEFSSTGAEVFYLKYGFKLSTEMLQSPECPLDVGDVQVAEQRTRQHHSRRLISLGTKLRKPRLAWKLWRESGLSISQLASGLRRYR